MHEPGPPLKGQRKRLFNYLFRQLVALLIAHTDDCYIEVSTLLSRQDDDTVMSQLQHWKNRYPRFPNFTRLASDLAAAHPIFNTMERDVFEDWYKDFKLQLSGIAKDVYQLHAPELTEKQEPT